MEKMTRIQVIRKFFSTPEKPVSLQELKVLTPKDREELAIACAKELGVELVNEA